MGQFAAVAGPALSIAGGLISGGKASDAAKGQAEALRAAADKASAMAQFNPYGMTTNFGTSTFSGGQGGYTLSPQLQAIQNQLFTQAGGYDPTQVAQAAQPLYGGASGLFQRGAEYLGQSPEQVSAKYMADQQALLQPSRAADFARAQSTNYGRGTGGLGVNTGTGGAPSNPLFQSLFNAQGRQDLQLAAQADQAAMDRAKFAAGLFGTGGTLLGQVPQLTTAGYGPLEAQLNLLGTTEKLGQQPFLLSQDLAKNYSTAGANAGNLYLQPQGAAASAYGKYAGYSPLGSAFSGAGSAMGGGGAGSSWFNSLLSEPTAASPYSGSMDFYGGASPTRTGSANFSDAGYGMGI
jgi:hypothetical protein